MDTLYERGTDAHKEKVKEFIKDDYKLKSIASNKKLLYPGFTFQGKIYTLNPQQIEEAFGEGYLSVPLRPYFEKYLKENEIYLKEHKLVQNYFINMFNYCPEVEDILLLVPDKLAEHISLLTSVYIDFNTPTLTKEQVSFFKERYVKEDTIVKSRLLIQSILE
jgi:hypothetical protein